MIKRPTIKGKGADFFLEQAKSELPKQKATFYLPKPLIDKLDDVWVDLRAKYRKLNKSDIASIAIEECLFEYEENHQDSKLLDHLNGKTSQQQ